MFGGRTQSRTTLADDANMIAGKGWPNSRTGTQFSKLVADADRGIDVVRLDVGAGHAIMHGAVHRAEIRIEVPVEPVVGIEGKGFEAAAASAVRNGRATRLASAAVGVLMISVVSCGQIEVGADRVANPAPINPHALRITVGIVGDEGANVAADGLEAGAQGSLRITVDDVLVAGKEFQGVELVERHEGIRFIVRDGRRHSL